MWKRINVDCNSTLADLQRLLDRWDMVASDEGELYLRPTGPALSPEDVIELNDRVRHADIAFSAVTIDLHRIERFSPQATMVLALLIRFGQCVRSRIHLTNVRAQPAAIVSLYNRQNELKPLLSA